NLLEEIDSAGNMVARYTNGLGIDQQLALLRSGTTSYYESDALGSVTSLSNSSGSLANTYTYDSFGRLTASTGTITNVIRFTGREFDSETGPNDHRARYYDTSVGRFIGEDPIQFRGGMNFYAYDHGRVVKFADRSGLDAAVYYYQGVGGNPFGHIGISLNNGPVYGFDARNNTWAIMSMLSLIPGTGVVVPASVMPVDNASRIPGDHVHIPTTPQQDAEIRAFIDNIRQHPGGYSLSGRNCT